LDDEEAAWAGGGGEGSGEQRGELSGVSSVFDFGDELIERWRVSFSCVEEKQRKGN
jgi:hypothetical protein